MSEFDPYHQWLGIPVTARPISKYRLLAIEDFELDRGVIGAAAERQTIYLRTLQAGEHEVLVAQLLNEVSQARVTLLNADQKAEYDEELRRQQTPEPVPEPSPPPIPLVQAPTPTPVVVRGTVTQDFPVSVVQTAKRARRRKPKEIWKRPAVIGVSVVGVIGVFVLFISMMSPGDAEPVASNTPPVVTSPIIPSPKPAPRPTPPPPTASNKTLPAKVAAAPPLAVAPFDAAQATAHQQAWSKYLGVPVEYTNSIGMKFMLIPPGKFIMGPKTSNSTVIISKPFYLGKYEVTKGDYYAVTKNGNEQHSKSRFPVTDIHSISAINFCKLLSSNTGQLYRLPTEAEWEHCCKAGTSTVYHFGEKDDAASEYAWYENNSGGVVHVVGQKSGNRWGIFDLLGNCREWCLNFYYQYASGEETDPMGPVDGKYRVLRGGSCDSSSPHIRSDWRSKYPVNYVRHMFGFRVVLEIPVRAQPDTIAAETNTLPPSLQEGLVAYYPFNGNAQDESGNGHDTTVSGPALTTDRFDNAYSAYLFDGVDDVVKQSNANLMPRGITDFTVSLWANATKIAGAARVFLANETLSQFQFNIQYSRLEMYLGGSQLPVSTGVLDWDLNQWYQVAATRLGDRISIYRNGELLVGRTISSSIHESALSLGTRRDGKHPWHGQLDDIRIYNRALSAVEIQQLYEYENSGVSEASVELIDQEEKPLPSLAPSVPVAGCQIHLPCDADDVVVRNGNPAIRNVIKEDDFGEVYGVVPVKKNGRSSFFFGGRDAKVLFRNRELGPAHTICMWVAPEEKRDILTLANYGGAGATFYVNTWQTSDRSLGLEIYKGTGFASSGKLVDFDRWQHVAVSVDFQSKIATLFRDGKIVGKRGQMKAYGTGGDLYFGYGAGNLNADFTFKGYMSDIRVFDRALSEAEVKSLYDYESKPPASPIPTAPEIESITNTIGMTLNKIPAGTFTMGSPEGEEGRSDHGQQHTVTITKPFYLQTTEVTQEQWTAVMGTEPWKGQGWVREGPNYPASYVSWNDAIVYCKNLSEKLGSTYRLPTEAEWEYACRAGTETRWSFGDDEKALGDYAWYKENAINGGEKSPPQVGLKKPNAFELYDMHANVYEWCHDYYGEDYYKSSPEKDPQGPASGSFRVLRGGSWSSSARYTRSAFRRRVDADNRGNNNIGFRVVRELD
jgi:sulfatase modifying factor 1